MKRVLIRIGFWLCLPLAAIQGLRLRQTALRLPEAKGERSGSYGSGPAFDMLALGDSIIAGVGTGNIHRSLPAQFANALAIKRQCQVNWTIRGKNGADIDKLLIQLSDTELPASVSLILISIGVNDVTGLTSTRYWRNQLNILAKTLRAKWPQAHVIFVGLPPMGKFPLPPQPLRFTLGERAKRLDQIATQVIFKYKNMVHIPTDIDPVEQEFCEDGFHPSADACGDWANELIDRFNKDSLL